MTGNELGSQLSPENASVDLAREWLREQLEMSDVPELDVRWFEDDDRIYREVKNWPVAAANPHLVDHLLDKSNGKNNFIQAVVEPTIADRTISPLPYDWLKTSLGSLVRTGLPVDNSD